MFALIGMLAEADVSAANASPTVPTWFVIASPFIAAGLGGLVGFLAAVVAAKINAGSVENAARIAAGSAAEDAVERSLERFHGERHIESRRNAYFSVLRDLLDYKNLCTESLHYIERDGLPNGWDDSEWGIKCRKAVKRLQESIVVDGLYFTEEAHEPLDAFLEARRKQIREGFIDSASAGFDEVATVNKIQEAVSKAASSALAALIPVAKKDLGIK